VAEQDFLPTASVAILAWRAAVLRRIREVFHREGYTEVEVPLLSQDGPVDPHLDAFTIEDRGRTYALQTSPEFGLKRLVAAGTGNIYQLGKAFRRGERGTRHNPEFTMLEWYRVGDTYLEQMDFVERLVRECAGGSLPANPFHRTTYRQFFLETFEVDITLATTAQLRATAESEDIAIPDIPESDRDGWLNLLLTECEGLLAMKGPEFLYDYPASQAALSRIRYEEFPVAERFELYIGPHEICNGYTELTDPLEMRLRIARESARRAAVGQPPLRESNRLLAAMEHGLPECAGVALGVDRLFMALGGGTSIDEVIAFPWERA
jgi:lysyl-tRNA synthetase class 2